MLQNQGLFDPILETQSVLFEFLPFYFHLCFTKTNTRSIIVCLIKRFLSDCLFSKLFFLILLSKQGKTELQIQKTPDLINREQSHCLFDLGKPPRLFLVEIHPVECLCLGFLKKTLLLHSF
jgi:hypothetical protein